MTLSDLRADHEADLRKLIEDHDAERAHWQEEILRLDVELAKARAAPCLNSGACRGEPHTCEQELIHGLEAKAERLRAARDEACDIAERYAPLGSVYMPSRQGTLDRVRLAELRKVGEP